MEPVGHSPLTSRPTYPPQKRKWPRKIALEEAITTIVFNATSTLPAIDGGAELPYVNTEFLEDVKKRLSDVDLRIQAMDKADIALDGGLLDNAWSRRIFDTATAVDIARRTNGEIHRLYTAGKYADRFRAFGCVAMQDPVAAATEAERCVKVLGFVGILINGYCNIGGPETVQYLDESQCKPFWTKLEGVDVPLYLHPRIPTPGQMRIFKGFEFLAGSPWGFGVETSTHSIRLMISGFFDRHPNLKIILGHCGEGLPFSLARIDHRMRHFQPHHFKCKLKMQQYWDRNFWITTASVTSEAAFAATLKSCGEDRLMWSVDHPYEDYDEVGEWFESLKMSDNTRSKIGWENSRKLLKIT